MKKTIAISVAIFLCVAIAMAGISFAQQKQWTTTCTHNTVGKTDNTYIIITYDKQTCTGCAYNTTANYEEEVVTVCG